MHSTSTKLVDGSMLFGSRNTYTTTLHSVIICRGDKSVILMRMKFCTEIFSCFVLNRLNSTHRDVICNVTFCSQFFKLVCEFEKSGGFILNAKGTLPLPV